MSSKQAHHAKLVLALEAGEGALDRLEAVLALAPVASIVLKAVGDGSLRAADVLPLVAAGQRSGAAVLVENDAHLARTVKADGVHLGVSEKIRDVFETARAVVGGQAVVGADAGRSRHDAMSLAELGADYVAFGVPAFVKDRETAFERQLDLVSWWAEIFEIPCVAMDVAEPDQAAAIVDVGADFVCLDLRAGLAVADAAELARQWVAAIEGTDVQPGGDE